MKTKKVPHVLHSTCSPMHRMYRICICGCQAIYIQVRPLRKGKFNGRIHGLLPAPPPGYILLLYRYCLCSTVFKVVKFKDTHIEHIFTMNCFLLLVILFLLCTIFHYFFRFIPKVVNLISPMTNNMDNKKSSRASHVH